MKIVKYILIGLGVIFAIYLGKAFLTEFSSSFAPGKMVDKAKKASIIHTLTSGKGGFSIDLPAEVTMYEKPEWDNNDGTTRGEVWFVFGQYDDNQPKGLVVLYGKPRIDGKGGACVDENGEGAYKTETIANQKVEVCEANGEFKAEYFTHPNKKAEYGIYTNGVTAGQMNILKAAVRQTLRFE